MLTAFPPSAVKIGVFTVLVAVLSDAISVHLYLNLIGALSRRSTLLRLRTQGACSWASPALRLGAGNNRSRYFSGCRYPKPPHGGRGVEPLLFFNREVTVTKNRRTQELSAGNKKQRKAASRTDPRVRSLEEVSVS